MRLVVSVPSREVPEQKAALRRSRSPIAGVAHLQQCCEAVSGFTKREDLQHSLTHRGQRSIGFLQLQILHAR
jgi:hypothetical protein